jgi:hypothetical protein
LNRKGREGREGKQRPSVLIVVAQRTFESKISVAMWDRGSMNSKAHLLANARQHANQRIDRELVDLMIYHI